MPKKYGIDEAWEILFDRHRILEQVSEGGVFSITSAEINTVKEARLMAKFDRSAQLPQIFRDNRLSILPVSRGEYLIGHFDTHRCVTYDEVQPKIVRAPSLQSLDCGDLYSEASALLFCYNSGIIADLLGSDRVYLTVNGRMSSGAFSYRIHDQTDPARLYPIQVQNAQVEIDAGYESHDAFCICEAKNMASEELLIRQLYYPYRLWRSKIAKPVIPVFLVYSNDLFHVFRYMFQEEEDYNSLKLLSHQAYTFSDRGVAMSDLIQLWRDTVPELEPKIPFPQANSFFRIVDLLSVLYERDLLREEVTLKYEFEPRQTDYYITACQYLDLVHRCWQDGTEYIRLTDEARRILNLRHREKYLALMGQLLKRPVFHSALGVVFNRGLLPNVNMVGRLMLQAGLSLSDNTLDRRASSVRGWISWMLSQCDTGEQLSFGDMGLP